MDQNAKIKNKSYQEDVGLARKKLFQSEWCVSLLDVVLPCTFIRTDLIPSLAPGHPLIGKYIGTSVGNCLGLGTSWSLWLVCI